jgi:glycogen synthase
MSGLGISRLRAACYSCSVCVLAVGNMYPPHHLGGYELVWRSAMRHLSQQGHETRVLSSDGRRHPRPPRRDPRAARAAMAVRAAHDYGPGLRGRARATLELPSQALIDLVEIGVLLGGSLRYRALVL